MSSARRPPTSSSPSPPLRHRSSPTTSSSSSSTTTATTSHHFPPMSDEDDAVLPPTSTNTNPTTPPSPSPSPPPPSTSTHLHALPPPPLPSTTTTTTKTTSFPIREDCWSEEATHTLIEAWGSHYLDLNRGNLRQKHWQEVADTVNGVHAHTKKLHRTDIQCKNRIDTLKKKYKVEKSKVLQSKGRHVSTWPFYASLDSLIGDSFIKANAPSSGTPPVTRKNSVSSKNTYSPATAPATATTAKKEFPVLPPLPSVVPVGPRSKRPAPAMGEEMVFRRNFSAMAAAAAAVADDEEDEDESDTLSAAAMGMGSGGMRRRKRRGASGKVAAEGYRKLAEAIGGFAEIYERVEEAKQRQMVELEKQRMQFAKDLEIQRMKLFMESQVQLEKLKISKRNSQSDGWLD